MSRKLLLYDGPASPFAQKVRIALRHKRLAFDRETPALLAPGGPDESFSSANIRMEVPALVDGDFKIFSSSAIMMYLEERFTDSEHPSLFPADASDAQNRAEARMIEEIVDTHYEAINWALAEIDWFGRAEDKEADILRAAATEQTKQIQDWLTTKLRDKAFFSGSSFGYADIAVAPVLNRSVYVGLGPEEGSALQQWHKRVGDIPCVSETWAEAAVMLPKMASLGADAWKKGAGRRREYRDHRLEFLVKNGGIGIVQRGLEDGNIRFSWPHPAKQI
jgi:glutathione S-transferase